MLSFLRLNGALLLCCDKGVSSSVDWRHQWDSSTNERLFRLSVGVEDANDLIEDLNQALH